MSYRRLLTILWLGFVRQGLAGHPLAVASVPFYCHRRTSRRQSFTSSHRPSRHSVRLASSTKRQRGNPKSSEPSYDDAPPLSYSDLGPVGRVVAGTVEVTVSTVMEYATGFFGGYFLGSVTDVPRLLFRNIDPERQRSFMQETSGRFSRMHGKSFRWAKSWGAISAAFGGFGVLVKVVRNGKEDEWNSILSSMAAGAFFSRAGTYLSDILCVFVYTLLVSCCLRILQCV
jgi:hypothetical protein